MHAQWELGFARLSDFRLHGVQQRLTGRFVVTGVSVLGTCALPSATFWESLRNRFASELRVPGGQAADATDAAELFRLVQQRAGHVTVWYCLHRDATGNQLLVAIGAPAAAARLRERLLPLQSMRHATRYGRAVGSGCHMYRKVGS